MILRAIDFETSGIPSDDDKHVVCEVGWCDLLIEDGMRPMIGQPQSRLVNPGRSISVEAMAVHHIRDCHVADAPPITAAFSALMDGADYFVAHKADFEQQFFGGGDRPWICTYKTALRVWPDAPAHSLQVLRYWLEFDEGEYFDEDLAMPPHRAAPDTYACAHLFARLLAETRIEQMVRWSSGPALLPKVGFGMHFGKKWSDVPRGYLDWVVNKSDITDRDVLATAKLYLRTAQA